MITSFANPNYQLNDADALNSNLPATQYYDNRLYDTTDDTTSKTNPSSKRRKKYGNMDLNSMGIDVGDGMTMNMTNSISSPDSLMSPGSEGQRSLDSALTSPIEKQTEIVEVEHHDLDSNGLPRSESKRKGFLGYYASLETSTKSRRRDEEEEESEEEEVEEGETPESTATPDSQQSSQAEKR